MADKQEQKHERLEQMIMLQIRKRKTTEGIWSMVSLADWSKVRKTLQSDVLCIVDGESGKKKLGEHGPNARVVRIIKGLGDEAFGYERATVQVYFKFDILSKSSLATNEFYTVMHELMHVAEFLHELDLHDDSRHYAYLERNAEFFDQAIQLLDDLHLRERLIREGDSISVWEQHAENFLNQFLELSKLEKGFGTEGAVKDKVKNWREKGEILHWLPNHVEMWALLGVNKIRSRDILEHYASGSCGEILQYAARWIAWRLSFDDEEKRLRQEALRFTEIHRMSEKEAEEHMQMVESRLREKRKAFEKEFDEHYYSPEKMILPDGSSEQVSVQEDASLKERTPAWYSHWECINCKKTAKTPWNEYPGGQCPRDKGGGNHNWMFLKKTDG